MVHTDVFDWKKELLKVSSKNWKLIFIYVIKISLRNLKKNQIVNIVKQIGGRVFQHPGIEFAWFELDTEINL